MATTDRPANSLQFRTRFGGCNLRERAMPITTRERLPSQERFDASKSVNGKKTLTDRQIRKSRTGILGFDEITGGGVPSGRPTIICGGPGCGKTMFAVEFLVRPALEFGEPGVFM